LLGKRFEDQIIEFQQIAQQIVKQRKPTLFMRREIPSVLVLLSLRDSHPDHPMSYFATWKKKKLCGAIPQLGEMFYVLAQCDAEEEGARIVANYSSSSGAMLLTLKCVDDGKSKGVCESFFWGEITTIHIYRLFCNSSACWILAGRRIVSFVSADTIRSLAVFPYTSFLPHAPVVE
jgi:hypothetical protein